MSESAKLESSNSWEEKVRMVGLGKMRCALRSHGLWGGRFGDEDDIVFIIFHRGFWMEQRQSNGLKYINT